MNKINQGHFLNSLLLGIILLFATAESYAVTITWLGGSGSWDNPARWDTGTVPTYNDDVVIPNGYARIYPNQIGKANSVHIQSNARLYVYNQANLKITGVVDLAGIRNEGRLFVWGKVSITGLSQGGVNIISGIHNSKTCYIANGGDITITNIANGYGIENISPGRVTCRGNITTKDIGSAHLNNTHIMTNSGTITLDAGNVAASGGIYNDHKFYNYSAGIITFLSGYHGIYNASSGEFENYGELNMADKAIGMFNDNVFTNFDSGSIIINDSSHGILNQTSDSEFYNNGLINILGDIYSIQGFVNYGRFENNHILYVDGQVFKGIENISGEFYNDAIVHTSGSYRACINSAYILNQPNGEFISDGSFENTATGTLKNEAFIFSNYDGNHILDPNGNFINYAVVQDNYHAFTSPDFINKEVYIHRIPGPMQVGVPYTNPIEVVSTNNITINDWVESYSNPTVVGNYDLTNNQFTPNSSAVYLATMYIDIDINNSGYSKLCALRMDNAITYFKGEPSDNRLTMRANSTPNLDIEVYPNPTTDIINVSCKDVEQSISEVKLYAMNGQEILSQVNDDNSQVIRINIPENATNQMYILSVIGDDKVLKTERIVLNR